MLFQDGFPECVGNLVASLAHRKGNELAHAAVGRMDVRRAPGKWAPRGCPTRLVRQAYCACMASGLPLVVGAHPLGVRPLGNAWFDGAKNTRRDALGSFAGWDDTLLLSWVSDWLDTPSLVALSATSRFWYALCHTPSIWRDRFVAEDNGVTDTWHGSWRAMYAALVLARTSLSATAQQELVAQAMCARVRATSVYSDVMYREFMTAALDPRQFLEHHARLEARRWRRAKKVKTGKAPARPELPDNMERVQAGEMDLETFTARYTSVHQPCILTQATVDWPCHDWSLDYIRDTWARRPFQAEAVRMEGCAYVSYARAAGGGAAPQEHAGVVPDTAPFYLFDAQLAGGDPNAARDWRVPALLEQCPLGARGTHSARDKDQRTRADLLSLMGDARPDYRWLIAGPARSGSGWHKDPNMTSAWNAVMQGSKYWMMLPPTTTPPGVYVSPDASEVTAPATLSEWMMDFYAETRAKHGPRELGGDGQLREGVCRAGEVMYVPSGWWHLVVNLDECVALTQNFVSVVELPQVLSFMKHTPDQISGFQNGLCKADVYASFCDKLRAYDAELLDDALRRMPKPASQEHASCAAHDKSMTKDWRARFAASDHQDTNSWSLDDALAGEELDSVPWL